MGRPIIRRRHPFKFQAARLSHDGFDSLVGNNQREQNEWNEHLGDFTKVLKQWNKNVFGDITGWKKEIHRRLRGIEKTLIQGPNDFLT